MDYGIWTLLPIVVVVAVALKSRRALEPLILGTLLTYIIVDGLSFPIGWMDAFFRVATDQSHQWVFMVCGLFGALIALLGASHGALGFSRLLGRLCRGPRTTLIVTWVMGILIFVDDYLNIMTLSTCMRKLTDRQKVPGRPCPTSSTPPARRCAPCCPSPPGRCSLPGCSTPRRASRSWATGAPSTPSAL